MALSSLLARKTLKQAAPVGPADQRIDEIFGMRHEVSTPQQKPAIGPEEDQASLRLGIELMRRVRPQGFVAGADAAVRR